MLVDTHCHIHESNYPLDVGEVMELASQAGVMKIICVGTSRQSSSEAIEFAKNHEHAFASIGVHPHDTKDGFEIDDLVGSAKIVAVGEIGLDYFYSHSPRQIQIEALESQLDVARKNNLPIIFHVREAFDDFWPIVDNFPGVSGVLHSFTDSSENMEKALGRGFFIGVNGISTFTKDETQKNMFASIPLENLLLETDAPFLTPAPHRGKVNEPAMVKNVAEYHAKIRGLSFEDVAARTTANAETLFSI